MIAALIYMTMPESLPLELVLILVQDILRFKDYSFLGEMRQKKGRVPVEPDLFEMHSLSSLIASTLPNDSNHCDGDANSWFASFVSAEPKVSNILCVDLAGPIIALNLQEVDPVVMNTFKNVKQLLHPGPHFISSVVDGIVLIMKDNILGIELEPRTAIVAPRVNGIDISLEEPLGR